MDPLQGRWNPTFLVVEDDPIITRLVVLMLRGKHYHVSFTQSGRETLLHINNAPPANLVILDLGLPDMDGCALVEALRAHPVWKDVPILIMSGTEEDAIIQKALALGADAFLSKPFPVAALFAAIESLEVAIPASPFDGVRKWHEAQRNPI
jgi:CheY-like chemotaxis protein